LIFFSEKKKGILWQNIPFYFSKSAFGWNFTQRKTLPQWPIYLTVILTLYQFISRLSNTYPSTQPNNHLGILLVGFCKQNFNMKNKNLHLQSSKLPTQTD
jgi:hypothetical protein